VTAGQLPTPDVKLTITTPRLRLTPLVLADADDLFRVLDDVRLHRFTRGSPLTRSELEAQIAKWQGRASPDESQIWLNWIALCVNTPWDTSLPFITHLEGAPGSTR
jgi:RimJ/RimL family protein N-acetyltransferase